MDLRPGERVLLGDTGVEIEVVHKSGQAARLRVMAPRSVRITKQVAAARERAIPSMAG
jgi:sRNA-binding carbon storage regulator CsrA